MLTTKNTLVAALVGIGVISLGVLGIGMFENLDASEVMVIQSPITGELSTHTEPGYKWQGFGKVTKYPRQAQYSFCSVLNIKDNIEDQCVGATTMAKRLRFSDGGHAYLNGSVNWEMPLDKESMINIHKKFGSAEGVESRAVGKMIDAAVYLAGPLMSSTESSGARRAELVNFINDQAENGVYVTVAKTIATKDASGNEVTEKVTEIVLDDKGQPKRQQGSILGQFNIKLLPMSINELKYDSIVESQIAQRQKSTTEVQIARANADRAKQDAITAEAEGQAKAAKAKWDQETINAKEIALAEKDVTVAKNKALEAEQFKREQILRGEGEAERKRLVMQADGALEKKLEAYVAVQNRWATAIENYKGALVPGVVMGNSSTNAGTTSQALIEMLSAKTAQDLALTLTNKGK